MQPQKILLQDVLNRGVIWMEPMRMFNAVVLIVTVSTTTETRLWEQRHPWLPESQSVKSQVRLLA